MSEHRLRCPHCAIHVVLPHALEVAPLCPACGKPVALVGKLVVMEWFLARGKKKLGPVSVEQLKQLAAQGKLAPTDMVLPAGAQKWVAAGDVQELFPRSIVPPAARTASVPLTCLPDSAAFDSRHQVLAQAQVVPEAANCVQCGMCSYNCPVGIDVRAHAWRGQPIRDSHCLTCSECVNRCPRGVLRFEKIPLFVMK